MRNTIDQIAFFFFRKTTKRCIVTTACAQSGGGIQLLVVTLFTWELHFYWTVLCWLSVTIDNDHDNDENDADRWISAVEQ